MAKQPVKTFHLLHVAKSLEAQYEQVMLLVSRAKAHKRIVEKVELPDNQVRQFLLDEANELSEQADRVAEVMWPRYED